MGSQHLGKGDPVQRMPPTCASAAYWAINKEVAPSGHADTLYTGLLQTQSSPQLLMGPARCLFISTQISTENRLLTMGNNI